VAPPQSPRARHLPGPRSSYPCPVSAGRVIDLRRWPFKAMAGERVEALELDRWGVIGDRAHAVFDVHGGAPRQVNAKILPRLLAWSAAYPVGALLARDTAPAPAVTDPAGTARALGDPQLTAALAEDLGRPLALVAEPRGHLDRTATVHLTVEASRRALEAALGAPVDVRRFRSNLHVELDAEPFAEERWVGRRLRVGAAELEVVEPCERCVVPTRDPRTLSKWPQLMRLLAAEHDTNFGLIARPLGRAAVRAGDAVELLSPRPAPPTAGPRRRTSPTGG
jgi:uncharacterized protein